MYYRYSTSSSIVVVVLLDLIICPQVCAPGVPQRLSGVSRFTEFEYPIILPKLSKYYTHAYILAEVDYHNYGNHLLPVYS